MFVRQAQSGLLIFSFVFAVAAVARPSPGDLPNRAVVTGAIMRGGRPTPEGLLQLKSYGVKTLINLEDDKDAVRAEGSMAPRLGMVEVSSPIHSLWWPNDKQMDDIVRRLQDASTFPIYLHCEHGQDRTGMVVGLYRVFVQHWAPQDAYREMLSMGFHPALIGLDQYFKRKVSKLAPYRGDGRQSAPKPVLWEHSL